MGKSKEMTTENIKEMLEKYKEILLLEVSMGANIGELTHLIGRIGEFFIALKYKGSMALNTNEKGYDVIDESNNKISVKSTSTNKGSHQFHFNVNTYDMVDIVSLVRVTINGTDSNKKVVIEEFLNCKANELKNSFAKREGYHLSASVASKISEEQAEEMLKLDEGFIIGKYYGFFKKYSFDSKDKFISIFFLNESETIVGVEIDQRPVSKTIKQTLVDICEEYNIETKRTKDKTKSKTNKELAKAIIKFLELDK